MPCIAHNATFKAATGNLTLLLSVQHSLRYHVEIPRNITPEVIAQNPLLFTLSGSKDGILAAHDELVTSKSTKYLLEYLCKTLIIPVDQNSLELGLDAVSEITTSPARDFPGFTVSFVNAKTTADLEFMPPILETLHLDYSWKTRPNFACDSATSGSDLYDCPFSKDLTLPLQTLLDDVIMRFVKNSLVRRYPFVFGNLARQFNDEATYFQPMITSIKRIVKRSIDPVFRSRCGKLFKLLRHRYHCLPDPDHTTENHDPHTSRKKLLTEAAFYLAMQRVFKAGMKCTSFKGTHGYIIDVEEGELLEIGTQAIGLSLYQVPSSPIEDPLLDQDENNSEAGYHRDTSPFEIFNFPHLDTGLARSTTPNADEMLFDTDNEDDDYLVDTDEVIQSQGSGAGDINTDLDESDEDETQESVPLRSVDSPVASYSKNLSTLPLSQRAPEIVLGINDSSSVQTGTGFYVKATARSMPLEAEYAHRHDLCTSSVSHGVEQARSGDSGTSQEKGYTHHMVCLAHEWTQVALSNSSPLLNSGISSASLPLDLTCLTQPFGINEQTLPDLDWDTNMEINRAVDVLEETLPGLDDLRGAIPSETLHESTIHSNSNSLSPALHQDDFLDVLSEGHYSDEELDIDDLDDCGMASQKNYIDCIIDEDKITDSPVVQITEELVLGDENFELVVEEKGPDRVVDGVRPQPSQKCETDLLWKDQDIEGWVVDKDETSFIELIA